MFILPGSQVAANNVAGAQANPLANFFVAGNRSDRGGVVSARADVSARWMIARIR